MLLFFREDSSILKCPWSGLGFVNEVFSLLSWVQFTEFRRLFNLRDSWCLGVRHEQ